jgi:hypothetical protein
MKAKKTFWLSVAAAILTGIFTYLFVNKERTRDREAYEAHYARILENNTDLMQNNFSLQDSIAGLRDLLKQDSADIAALTRRQKEIESQRNYWKHQATLLKPAQIDSFLVARYQTQHEDTIKKKVVIELIDYDHQDSLLTVVLEHNEVLQSKVFKLESIIAAQDSIINNMALAYDNLEEIIKLKNKEIEEAWAEADKAKRNTKLIGGATATFTVLLLLSIAIL